MIIYTYTFMHIYTHTFIHSDLVGAVRTTTYAHSLTYYAYIHIHTSVVVRVCVWMCVYRYIPINAHTHR